jgi:hypothetical protein
MPYELHQCRVPFLPSEWFYKPVHCRVPLSTLVYHCTVHVLRSVLWSQCSSGASQASLILMVSSTESKPSYGLHVL